MMAMNGPDFVVSLREVRILIDRLLQWKGFSAGRRPALTESALYSASLGLSGFEVLLDNIDALKIGIENHSLLNDSKTNLCLDAQGKHAWAVAEEISDLLTEMDRCNRESCVKVVNLAAPEELAVVGPLIQKHGLNAQIEILPSGTAVTHVVGPSASEKNELLRICHQGIPTKRELWFELFQASNAAQAPDTKLSRTHASTTNLAEDNTFVGLENSKESININTSLPNEENILKPVTKKGKEKC